MASLSTGDMFSSAQPPPRPPRIQHPTTCPPWCRDLGRPAAHHYGPRSTYHWGRQIQILSPRPLSTDDAVILRAELYRADEDGRPGTRLYVSGETDGDLPHQDAADLIQQLNAFTHTLHHWLTQMPT